MPRFGDQASRKNRQIGRDCDRKFVYLTSDPRHRKENAEDGSAALTISSRASFIAYRYTHIPYSLRVPVPRPVHRRRLHGRRRAHARRRSCPCPRGRGDRTGRSCRCYPRCLHRKADRGRKKRLSGQCWRSIAGLPSTCGDNAACATPASDCASRTRACATASVGLPAWAASIHPFRCGSL
jgi:hypothetical protein